MCVYMCMCVCVCVCVYLCVHVCDIVSGVQFVCLGVRLCMSALFVCVCIVCVHCVCRSALTTLRHIVLPVRSFLKQPLKHMHTPKLPIPC